MEGEGEGQRPCGPAKKQLYLFADNKMIKYSYVLILYNDFSIFEHNALLKLVAILKLVN